MLDAVQRLGPEWRRGPTCASGCCCAAMNLPRLASRRGQEWLLELKEERDPPQPTQWLGRGPLGNNGQRVFAGTRCLLASPDSEPDLGYVAFGSLSLQGASRAARTTRIRRPKLAERLRGGRYAAADVVALASTMGGLVASGHARCGDAGRACRPRGTLAVPGCPGLCR